MLNMVIESVKREDNLNNFNNNKKGKRKIKITKPDKYHKNKEKLKP